MYRLAYYKRPSTDRPLFPHGRMSERLLMGRCLVQEGRLCCCSEGQGRSLAGPASLKAASPRLPAALSPPPHTLTSRFVLYLQDWDSAS